MPDESLFAVRGAGSVPLFRLRNNFSAAGDDAPRNHWNQPPENSMRESFIAAGNSAWSASSAPVSQQLSRKFRRKPDIYARVPRADSLRQIRHESDCGIYLYRTQGGVGPSEPDLSFHVRGSHVVKPLWRSTFIKSIFATLSQSRQNPSIA